MNLFNVLGTHFINKSLRLETRHIILKLFREKHEKYSDMRNTANSLFKCIKNFFR